MCVEEEAHEDECAKGRTELMMQALLNEKNPKALPAPVHLPFPSICQLWLIRVPVSSRSRDIFLSDRPTPAVGVVCTQGATVSPAVGGGGARSVIQALGLSMAPSCCFLIDIQGRGV